MVPPSNAPPLDDAAAVRSASPPLINHVVPDGQALAKAKEIAARIAKKRTARR